LYAPNRGHYIHHSVGRNSQMAHPIQGSNAQQSASSRVVHRMPPVQGGVPAAIQGQQQMKTATSRTSKLARTKVSTLMVTPTQLDCELASACHLKTLQHLQHGITKMVWHCQIISKTSPAQARLAIATKPAGAPQANPCRFVLLYY
jgi:hypothetical protein